MDKTMTIGHNQDVEAKQRQSRVIKWMGPILDVLRMFGGSGKPKDITWKIAEILEIPDEIRYEKRDSGVPKFYNEVAWARLILVKEGYIEPADSNRGIWTLSELGKNKHLNEEESRQILQKRNTIRAKRRKKGNDDSISLENEDGLCELEVGTNTEPEETKDPPIELYTIEDILSDGCFIERVKLQHILERLKTKKNLILQGPPGTGKTWLAKRLAFTLIGQRDDSRVRALQFHPNLSYEDFIRGWRPTGEGKLSLVDGPFLEMIINAQKDTSSPYVMVIEEINRGNPAQIFGEMLTLLEIEKRTHSGALELCYRRTNDERVFIPDNLYVIGTMNIADRSLALVDFALRRRFAFVDLEPVLGKIWREWVSSQCGIEMQILDEIDKRITALNDQITADTTLGPQFRIGHSYVTPPRGIKIVDAREWFIQVVDTEIGPLLKEYWFDAIDKARNARLHLIEGL